MPFCFTLSPHMARPQRHTYFPFFLFRYATPANGQHAIRAHDRLIDQTQTVHGRTCGGVRHSMTYRFPIFFSRSWWSPHFNFSLAQEPRGYVAIALASADGGGWFAIATIPLGQTVPERNQHGRFCFIRSIRARAPSDEEDKTHTGTFFGGRKVWPRMASLPSMPLP